METNTYVLDRIDVEQAREVARKIQEFHRLLTTTLVKGQDYGEVPGTSKPTLLLPGAQRVAMMLQLVPSYAVLDRVHDLSSGYIRFEISCLLSTRDGLLVSQGLGSCSSFETKYRWKWVSESEAAATGAESSIVRKDDYGRVRVRVQKQDELFDLDSTLEKMAAKRAYVSAVLTVAALTGVFTQDLEDLPTVVQSARAEPTTTTTPDSGSFVIGFGNKHRGKTLGEIVKTDRGYLDWLASNANSTELRTVVRKFLAENPIVAKAPASKSLPFVAKPPAVETPAEADDTSLDL